MSAAITISDTSRTVSNVPAGTPTSGSLLIDSEIITYTGISGVMLTGLTRGTTLTNAANNTIAAVHAFGAVVTFLAYANIMAWIKATVLQAAQAAVLSLGTHSVFVGTNQTTINTNQTTINTDLTTAVQ